MSDLRDVTVPDIGEFDNVDVIEVLVVPGDRVELEQSLITLESDKATMEIPSPVAGVVREIAVAVGGQVSEGDLILKVESTAEAETREAPKETKEARVEQTPPTEAAETPAASTPAQTAPSAAPPDAIAGADLHAEVLVLGAGPGGYTAAFRAADLGKRVVLVERYDSLGGVCLNVGCIPSKALLHLSEVIEETRAAARHGVVFGEPRLDLDRIRDFKNGVVDKLTQGLAGLAKRRKVEVVTGAGRFESPHTLVVEAEAGSRTIAFDHAIIAVGSQAVQLPGLPWEDERVMDSTGALELRDVPERLLVIGGGIIGLEMASVFKALGSRVTVVELLDELMAGADRDLVKPLQKIIEGRYERVLTGTRVSDVKAADDGLHATFDAGGEQEEAVFDRVLVAVGRRPNGSSIGADAAGVAVDERGFIAVDDQQRTNVPHIHAIGDVVGEPMLAHKASHEGKVAAEVIAGHKVKFAPATIPSVAYTDPEVAWMGLTETEAKSQGRKVQTAKFPWQASGRALGIGRAEGQTKLVLDPETRTILGGGIVGPNAGELIGELVLALEMGADAEDLALTVHPHPTLSETVGFAAEMAEGTITDLYIPKRKKKTS